MDLCGPDILTIDKKEYIQGSKAIPRMHGLREKGKCVGDAWGHALDGHMGSRSHMAI